MAGRPKRRARLRAKRNAFLQARYENAGDYIRFKRSRKKTYGPVRFEEQPRWVRAKGRKGKAKRARR